MFVMFSVGGLRESRAWVAGLSHAALPPGAHLGVSAVPGSGLYPLGSALCIRLLNLGSPTPDCVVAGQRPRRLAPRVELGSQPWPTRAMSPSWIFGGVRNALLQRFKTVFLISF